MNRAPIRIVILVAASLVMVSCGSSTTSSQPTTSGISFRVFVSNPLQPATGGGGLPVLNIVNASDDLLSGFTVGLSSTIPQPGLMELSPNRLFTIVFSAANNAVAVVDNLNESPAQTASGTIGAINLPGFTESMFIATDNATAYAAVPTALVMGQMPGAVVRMNLGAGRVSATVAVPGAKFIVPSHTGNRILALDGVSNTLTILAPSLIGTNSDSRTLVCPDGTPAPAYDVTMCASSPPAPLFDHPVWAVFSPDDTTAYIFNCGPECLGTTASITVLDLNSNTATVTIPVEGATYGLLSGNTLYVAGTPPTPPGGNSCTGSNTLATTCGRLDVVDLGSMTVTGSAIITDGSHSHMEIGANGRIFIGATHCSDINVPGEIRGCLSMVNSNNLNVVVAPFNGDVTGLQQITGRDVVYVVEAGELRIYDTTTDALQSTQINIIGQAIDVKLVDQ